ncbi:oligopeptide ABC transporter substrate-binding protein [Enterococcus sp. HY326]|uniref:oligopeptide ABC transporter substrate-binding protein n=1 Tax=Enterococcus sp. HY326 TaxID=2971265 RepID=UPI00223FD7AC|nr:oligopeptide ABC transporter substrate-binding protein [Enterococcus sp. HY326]
MKRSKHFGLLTTAGALTLLLAACQGGNTTDSGSQESNSNENITESFTQTVVNDADAIEGGTLDVAVASDTQFVGLFSETYYTDAYDNYYMTPSHEPIFSNDDDFVITDDGVATLELDEENNTATVTLTKEPVWSDGEPVTSEDLAYPYEVIGHPDYTGIRYDSTYSNIVGMDEYHAGTADTISGLTIVDDKTIQITFKEMNPNMLQLSGGINASAMPKHVFESIPVADQEQSDAVRTNPVTFGPYYMSSIVTGESVEYLPNEYYYQGTPKLDKLVFTNVSTSSIVESLNSKTYDLVYSMPTDNYPDYSETDGYQMLGREQMAYTYIGFKLGTYDTETGENITDPNAKMSNVNLRQAMGYAVDNDAIGERFYHGLRSGASTLIPPVFQTLHDSSITGYTYDPDKANELLDEAGYVDVDDDGIREDPDGEKLTINFASMSGGETAQPLADYYIQQWEAVGLDVELTSGRLIDFQAFYDRLENDDTEIDVFQGAWNTGTAPSPAGLYGRTAAFNYTRFTSDENDELLAAIDSQASFDDDARVDAYSAWQEYMVEQAVVIPTLYRNEILPVSNRVKSYTWNYNETEDYFTMELTSETRD